MPLLKSTPKIDQLLREHKLEVAGFGAEATVVTETATFLWDTADSNTDIVLTRERAVDANSNLVRSEAWAISNAPTITSVTTDQATNTDIDLNGATVLTVTGTNYGEEDADLEVWVFVQPASTPLGPHPNVGGRIPVEATITNVNAGDTAITASVILPANYREKVAAAGICEVEVRNIKRYLASARYSGLTVV